MEQYSSDFQNDISVRAAYYFANEIMEEREIYIKEEEIEDMKNRWRLEPLSESEIATKVKAFVSLIMSEIEQSQDELRDLKNL